MFMAEDNSRANSQKQTGVLTTDDYNEGNIAPMTDTRLERFRELASRFEKQKDFASQAGMAAAHVSQVLAGKRKLGDAVARRIEQKFGYPRGWIDDQLDASENQNQPIGEAISVRKHIHAAAVNFEVRKESCDAILSDLFYRVLAIGYTPDDIDMNPRIASKSFGLRRYDMMIIDVAVIDVMSPTKFALDRLFTSAFIAQNYGLAYFPIVRITDPQWDQVFSDTKRFIGHLDAMVEDGYLAGYCTDVDGNDLIVDKLREFKTLTGKESS